MEVSDATTYRSKCRSKKDVPGQYLDIALVPGQYLDIALVAGQYKIYCPPMSFDLPTQSVTCISYNTGTRALPDIYALALGRAVSSKKFDNSVECINENKCAIFFILHT